MDEPGAGLGMLKSRRRAVPADFDPASVVKPVISLDTHVLARYGIDDPSDQEAQRQRLAARRPSESGRPLRVSKSVILELEWVRRSFDPAEVASVMRILLERAHITVDNRDAVERALSN